jgi:hypothetical protein
MCFGPRSSLTSFIVGSVLNTWVLVLLEQWRTAPNSSLHATTHAALVTVVLAMEFALLMQVPECLAWLDLDQSKGWNYAAAKAALPLNLLQPVVLLLLALLTGSAPTQELSFACVVLLLYLSLTHIVCNVEVEWTSLTMAGSSCPHLDLAWWSLRLFRRSYIVCLFLLLFLVLKPVHVRIATMLYVSVTLLFSMWLYGCTDGVTGSVWCWLIALGPISIYAVCCWWASLNTQSNVNDSFVCVTHDFARVLQNHTT